MLAQAGQLNVLCFSAYVLNFVGVEEYFLVLDEHYWGTMVWPLVAISRNSDPADEFPWQYSLDLQGQARWLCVYDPSMVEVQPTEMKWSDEIGLTFSQFGHPQPLLRISLFTLSRSYRTKLLHLWSR